MSWFIALEIFIELTQPGGGKVWIEESHIVAIRPHLGNCAGKTVIAAPPLTLCVMETPEQIRELIKNANPKAAK